MSHQCFGLRRLGLPLRHLRCYQRNGVIYKLERSYCEKIHIRETVRPFKVRLKAHSNTIIYRPCPTAVENFNRALPSPPQPGGIPPIICQQQLASVTLHLGSVLSLLREAHPLRRNSGLPLQHTSAVTSAPPTDRRHSSPPSSSHRSPTGSTRSTRCSHSRAPPHGCDRRPTRVTGSLSKPRRQRQRERSKIKGLMSRTIAVHMRYKSLYILLPSSAKQLEMTKFFVV